MQWASIPSRGNRNTAGRRLLTSCYRNRDKFRQLHEPGGSKALLLLTTNTRGFPISTNTSIGQTCQPLLKENLETHEKKSGDSTKNSEILFFSPIKPLFHRGN